MKKQNIKYFGVLCCMLILMFGACKKDNKNDDKPQPKVTDYYPNSGNDGTLVTIEGTGFSSNIGDVSATFAGTSADVVSATSTAVVLRAPKKGVTGSIVLNMAGLTIPIGNYTFQQLSVQKINPTNGAAGTHINITGAGFSSIAGPVTVSINGKPATVVNANDTLVVVEVPVAAGTGPVKVTVNGKEATGQTFKFQAISAIKPLTGGKGTVVRVSGEGFENVIAGNTVDFNGTTAVVTEAGTDHLLVIAPDAVQTGPLSVTINGQKIGGPVFTVVPPPTIQTVTPLSGPANTVMTISGTTFSNILDENKVTVNGITIPITSATATQLTLTIPGGTGNGKVIVTVNGQAVEGPVFKDQSIGITSFSPANGLAGTHVVITGLGFNTSAGSNIVTFNGVQALVVNATSTSLEVIAPDNLTSGPLKVTNSGVEALAPTNFYRAGVVTLAGGSLNNLLNLSPYRTVSLVADSKGNVFVIEGDYSRIKKISTDGTVSVFAGSPSGARGSVDGQGTAALFNLGTNPGMDIDANDNLFISDGTSLRKVTPQGMVSTFATGLGTINKIAFDENGILYALGSFNGGWSFQKDGTKTVLSLLTISDVARPAILNNIIYKVQNPGYSVDMYTIGNGRNTYNWVGNDYGFADGIGKAAMFQTINALASDRAGNIFLSDGIAIRKINIATQQVTTIAQFTRGAAVDGALNNAKSGLIGDVFVDKNGDIYFVDMTNNAVRKIFLK
ncbi:IPT/TIG domain-containing protein [Mucilaginibacter paludis]|uniref:Cell surface receptor IPT/TIG domain protein n=1 Tax=Mucilaginibacter paludis DSM 18603 TaxID=714943 RepID=H1YBN0_9SPHI|nr:IPT/TIG domain-containing protein [Mucilaginibacter paludis]EHQ25993.1 cell surface receptor IPT/TIG domain protein [Mucilaginibacter paludis DSM 18603]